MPRTRFPLICVAVVVVAACLVHPTRAADDQDAVKQQERELIEVLRSDASKADKAITCKRLAVYGSADAVPALARLLPDEELASWARIALEVIPGPAADQALREALDQVQGRTLIGVINSLGVRRDAEAVEPLAARLKDSDPAVAEAAAIALGSIGNSTAAEVLEQTLSDCPESLRSTVAEGCILCGEQLQDAGRVADAIRLYDQVRQADVPTQRIIEAARGAIIARQADGVPLLVELLQSDDKKLVAMGLATARELAIPEVTTALMDLLEGASPDRQTLLIMALADRGDAEALPAMLEAAQEGADRVRIAAIDVISRLGDVSCVPVLLEIAAGDDVDVAEAAKAALEALSGEEVDAELAERLPRASGTVRVVLIELIGLRRIDAVPALIAAVEDADAEVRAAALTALGSTVDLANLSVLLSRVVEPQNDEDTEFAVRALRVACVRMGDREACAARLADAMDDDAPLVAKRTLLEILSAMGGPTAVKTVGAAARSGDPELQDTASRVLGEWMTVDAAPVLLNLAAVEGPYQVRALRGYIRIARQFDLPDVERAEMCRQALMAAERDAEKKLVLEVLQRYPSVNMLKLAVKAAEIPALKSDATATAMVIAREIGGTDNVRQLLEQIGQEPVRVEIVKAQYGADDTFKDVTAVLQRHAGNLSLIVLPSSSYNSAFGGDPVPGVVKQLKIQYRMNGKPGEVTLTENASILLPMPE